MFRTHAHVHFRPDGEPTGVAIELHSMVNGDRLALVVMPVGPFDDFSDVYARCYERAVEDAHQAMPGQMEAFPQDHPRMLLRRATDLQTSPPM